MKVELYGYPECKQHVSKYELERNVTTFYTKIMKDITKSKIWVPKEVLITEGLEVCSSTDEHFRDKFALCANYEINFGEYPKNPKSKEDLLLEITELVGFSSRWDCNISLREYTCKISDYQRLNKEMGIYNVMELLELEEQHGL